ncbi:hypothetical protein EDD21DRAFT_90144 [Dissophora ornata]|nr:hypothetical protein EDD21DRAFT_90144 [Dissophora ornata]
MYSSNPYPPPRSRISSSNNGSSSSSSSTRVRTTSIQPNIVESGPSSTLFRPSAAPTQSRRYSYKTRPVVYTPLARSIPHTPSAEESVSPSQKKASFAHKLITPSAPGAIVDFFKEINPDHSQQQQHASASHHTQVDSGSRSPSSPLQPPSKTIQMLREDVETTARYERYHTQLSKKQPGSGALMENVKIDGDFSWLEDDDDDDRYQGGGGGGGSFAKKEPGKAPVSLEEAGRQFFNRLIGK